MAAPAALALGLRRSGHGAPPKTAPPSREDGVPIPGKSRVSRIRPGNPPAAPGIKFFKPNRNFAKPWDVLGKRKLNRRRMEEEEEEGMMSSDWKPNAKLEETMGWEGLVRGVIPLLLHANDQESVARALAPLESHPTKKLACSDVIFIIHGIRHRKRAVYRVWEYWHSHKNYVPDSHLFTKVISILGRGKMYKACMSLVHVMLLEGCKIDACLYNVLICVYGRIGKPELALELFAKMPLEGVDPTVVTYGSIINVLVKCDRMDDALSVLRTMKKSSNTSPNVQIFNAVLHGMAKKTLRLDLTSILNEMVSHGAAPDSITFTIFLRSYQQAESYDQIAAAWRQLRRFECAPDSQLFTIVLLALSRLQHLAGMERVFELMMKVGCPADCFSYSVLLQAYARSGNIHKLQTHFESMISSGIKPNPSLFNTLLYEFSQNGNLTLMRWTLQEMLHHGCCFNKQTFEIMVEAYAREGRVQCMSDAFACMQRFGFRPKPKTLNQVLSVYTNAGLVSEVESISPLLKKEKAANG